MALSATQNFKDSGYRMSGLHQPFVIVAATPLRLGTIIKPCLTSQMQSTFHVERPNHAYTGKPEFSGLALIMAAKSAKHGLHTQTQFPEDMRSALNQGNLNFATTC